MPSFWKGVGSGKGGKGYESNFPQVSSQGKGNGKGVGGNQGKGGEKGGGKGKTGPEICRWCQKVHKQALREGMLPEEANKIFPIITHT